MKNLIDAITSGALPLILAAMSMIIPALAAYAVAWLKARTRAQEAAVSAAVAQVAAMRSPSVALTGPEAKAVAMRLVAERLPTAVPKPEKLDQMIEAAVEKRVSEIPPP